MKIVSPFLVCFGRCKQASVEQSVNILFENQFSRWKEEMVMAPYRPVNTPFATLCESSESYGNHQEMKAQSELAGHWGAEAAHVCLHG